MYNKICNACNIEYSINEFPIIKNHGKLVPAGKCKKCFAEYKAKHNKNSYEKYKEKRILNQRKYHDTNKDTINEKRRLNKDIEKLKKEQQKKYLKNRDVYIQNAKIYYENNKEYLNKKKAERYRERIKNDPLFKLKKNISALIRSKIKNKGYTKSSRTHEILGCSFEEFKQYLESKFEPWMTWDNYGKYNGQPNYGWDIDHIKPLASAKIEELIISLNHYTNLQPLCSYYNRDIKRDT